MRTLKYFLNIITACLIVYFVRISFLIINLPCDYFQFALEKTIYFQTSRVLFIIAIASVLNSLIEWKIEKSNFVKRTMKIALMHFILFIIIFVVSVLILHKSIC